VHQPQVFGFHDGCRSSSSPRRRCRDSNKRDFTVF
jgi:hypothetical protein